MKDTLGSSICSLQVGCPLWEVQMYYNCRECARVLSFVERFIILCPY